MLRPPRLQSLACSLKHDAFEEGLRNHGADSRIDATSRCLFLGIANGSDWVPHPAAGADEPVLVAHADNLSIGDAREFCDAHETNPSPAQLTMMTFTTDDPFSWGIVTTDARGVVDGFFENPGPSPMPDPAVAWRTLLEQQAPDAMRTIERLLDA